MVKCDRVHIVSMQTHFLHVSDLLLPINVDQIMSASNKFSRYKKLERELHLEMFKSFQCDSTGPGFAVVWWLALLSNEVIKQD